MRSIDNLREYALTAASVNATTRAVLAGYIDAIEFEVKELTDERDLLKTKWEAGVDFDQRLEACADNREDVTLFGVDYTALPVDADGVPIHVGDVMELDSGAVEEVESMHYYGSGGWTTTTTHNATAMPSIIRHHHAPTVEDVLREYALKCEEAGNSGPEVKRLAAEYAARLMLAGEE